MTYAYTDNPQIDEYPMMDEDYSIFDSDDRYTLLPEDGDLSDDVGPVESSVLDEIEDEMIRYEMEHELMGESSYDFPY